MALRKIVVEGDEILRKKCREVEKVDDRIRSILDDMLETLHDSHGVGIAAPQVGIMRRMFIVEVEEGDAIELINPRMIKQEGAAEGEEGCLSIPGYVGTVVRPEYVKIEGLNRNGEKIVCEGRGLKAVAFCHEYDHLDGILYTDKATEVHLADEED